VGPGGKAEAPGQTTMYHFELELQQMERQGCIAFFPEACPNGRESDLARFSSAAAQDHSDRTEQNLGETS
jgi:hypothetical protein